MGGRGMEGFLLMLYPYALCKMYARALGHITGYVYMYVCMYV